MGGKKWVSMLKRGLTEVAVEIFVENRPSRVRRYRRKSTVKLDRA